MTILYRRCWKLTFFDINKNEILTIEENLNTINPPRITFFVRQIMFLINYTANFVVYNLSESTRSLLATAYSVSFEVGYDDTIKLLHVGRIINLFDLRNQPDYSTVIATQDIMNKLSPTIDAGKKTETQLALIKRVMAQMAPDVVIDESNLVGIKDIPTNQDIRFDSVNYIGCMAIFEEKFNVNMWTVNKVLYTSIKDPDKVDSIPDKTIILNYKNGMIGSPQIDLANTGISVKSLINAEIKPGNFIKIETINPNINLGDFNYTEFSQQQATRGTWRIYSVDHIGDSRGDEWYSNVTGFGFSLILKAII